MVGTNEKQTDMGDAENAAASEKTPVDASITENEKIPMIEKIPVNEKSPMNEKIPVKEITTENDNTTVVAEHKDDDALKEINTNDRFKMSKPQFENIKESVVDGQSKLSGTTDKLKNCSVKMVRITEPKHVNSGNNIKAEKNSTSSVTKCSVKVAKLDKNSISQFTSIRDIVVDGAVKRSTRKGNKEVNDENVHPKKIKQVKTVGTTSTIKLVPARTLKSPKTVKPAIASTLKSPKTEKKRKNQKKMGKMGIHEHKVIKTCSIKVKKMSNNIVRMKHIPGKGVFKKNKYSTATKEQLLKTNNVKNDAIKNCQIKLKKLSDGIEMHSKRNNATKPCIVSIQKLSSATGKDKAKRKSTTVSESMQGRDRKLNRCLRQGTRRSYVYF